jgi:SRSO17 transposase
MPDTFDSGLFQTRFRELTRRIASRFVRKDLEHRARGYLRGLLERVERKNSWQLAEAVGDATPHGFQRLLGRARWDADAVRDDLRNYVVEHLGEPDGVLIVDETGFLKKGTKSAGVARQYSGTAGRIENCQIGVFLSYRSSRGAAFIDRALYLPKAWIEDPPRRREAGIPEKTAFATKPELARAMIREAVRAGVPARWATADEVYGGDSKFRRMLEAERLDYVVAVTSAQRIWADFRQVRVATLAAELAARAWKRLSCGAGAKGERFYDWAFIALPFQADDQQHKGVLFRRSIGESPEHAYYLCGFKPGTPLEELVRVAGCRWAVESGFEQAKQEVGLDDYEVRGWDGWHRHVTFALLAHAFLEVLRAEDSGKQPKKRGETPPSSSR